MASDYTFLFGTNLQQVLAEVDTAFRQITTKLNSYKATAAAPLSRQIGSVQQNLGSQLLAIPAQNELSSSSGKAFDAAKPYRDLYRNTVVELDRVYGEARPGLNAAARRTADQMIGDLKQTLGLQLESQYSAYRMENRGALPGARFPQGVLSDRQRAEAGLTTEQLTKARTGPVLAYEDATRQQAAAAKQAAAATQKAAVQTGALGQAEREFTGALEQARLALFRAMHRFGAEASAPGLVPGAPRITDGRVGVSYDSEGGAVASVSTHGRTVHTTNQDLVNRAAEVERQQADFLRIANEQVVEAKSQQRVNQAYTKDVSQRSKLSAQEIAAKKKVVAHEQLLAAGATRVGNSRFLSLNNRGFQVVDVQRGANVERGAVPVSGSPAVLGPQYERAVSSATKAADAQAAASLRAARADDQEAISSRRAGAAGQYTRLERAAGTVVGGPAGMGGVGRSLRPGDLAQTAFSFTRYVASAALIGGGIAAISQAKQEILDYSDSVKDLEIAMSRIEGPSARFKDNLSQIASVSGADPGQAIDAAARSIRAFNEESEHTPARTQAFARAVSELSLLSGKAIPDLAGDAIASLTSYDLEADDAKRFADAIVSARQSFGGDLGQTSQGVALLSSVAKQAGFELEELANMVNLINSRTDQTGQAITTRLSRIFSMVGGSAGKTFLAQLNQQLSADQQIDLQSPVANQLRQLQEAYPTLPENQQQRALNALGGTSALKELVPLLTEGTALNEALARSYERSGESTEEFNKATQELRARLAQIAGSIREIVIEVSESGLLDAIGLTIAALNPALDIVSELLKVYNQLPRPLRTILALTLEVVAAAKIWAAFSSQAAAATAAGAASRMFTARGVAAGAAMGAGARVNLLPAAATTGMVAQFGKVGTGIMASLRGLLFSPVGIAVGALTVGFFGLRSALANISEAVASATDDFRNMAEVVPTSPSDLRDSAAGFESQADVVSASSGGFFGTIINALRGDPTGKASDFYLSQAQGLRGLADEYDRLVSRRQQGGSEAFIDTSSLESMKESLELLDVAGLTSAERVQLLQAAIENLGGAADEVASALNTNQLREGGARLRGQMAEVAGVIHGELGDISTGRFQSDNPYSVGQIPGLDRTDYQKHADGVREQLADHIGVDSDFSRILPELFRDLAVRMGRGEGVNIDREVDRFVNHLLSDTPLAEYPGLLDALNEDLADQLVDVLGSLGVSATRGPSNAELNNLISEAGAALASRDPNMTSTLNALDAVGIEAGTAITTVMGAMIGARPPEGPQPDVAGMLFLADQVVEEARLQAERIRLRGIINDHAEKASVQANDHVLSAMRREKERLLDEGVEPQQLEKLNDEILSERADLAQSQRAYQSRLDAEAAERKRKAEEARRAAEQAAREAEEAARRARELRRSRTLAGPDPRDNIGLLQAELSLLKTELRESSGSEYYDTLRSIKEAEVNLAKARKQRWLSFITAKYVDPESDLHTAREALRTAEAELGLSLKGTEEFYDAQFAVRQAQLRLSDAQSAAVDVRRRLNSDLTNPVIEARLALREAERKLQNDLRRGAAPDVINQDRLDVRSAQTNLESTAFQQRFRDAQLANDLGDMSHKAYMRYLEDEQKRLSRVKDRTRQQNEQLLQIRQAIKAASDQLQGQFNLGDIRIPRPYEVRRAMKSRLGFDGAAGGPTVVNNRIEINGADLAKVIAYLESALGSSAYARTSTSVRKV